MEVSELLGNMSEHSLGYIGLCFLVWSLGVVTHFVKKCTREGITFKAYWTEHKSSSVASIITGIISLFTLLVYYPSPDIVTLFCAGYINDSVVNKAPPRRM